MPDLESQSLNELLLFFTASHQIDVVDIQQTIICKAVILEWRQLGFQFLLHLLLRHPESIHSPMDAEVLLIFCIISFPEIY